MHELMSRFSIIHRQSSVELDRKLKAHPVTASQYTHILVICEHPGISQEEISHRLRTDKGSVARTIKQFENEGYVVRRTSSRDRRSYQLFPTEKARELYRAIHGIAVESENQLVKNFTQPERETLIRLLDKVIQNLNE